MKNSFNAEIIFNKQKNKSQGVLVQESKPEYIPEIIGLTKMQLFLFILFAILLGSATFGLGSYINTDNINKAKKKESEYKKILFETKHNQERETYILFGSFIDPENAKILQTKIEIATGKTCLLIHKDNNIQVILGPFTSKEIAFNEMKLIEYRMQISGSLFYAI